MGATKRLLVTTVLVGVASMVLYSPPVPQGYSQPWKVHLGFRMIGLAKLSVYVWEELGLGPSYPFSRHLWNDGETVKGFFKRLVFGEDHSLKIMNTDFGGIPVRIYVPVDKANNSGGLVFFHGGGWTIGGIEAYDGYTRKIASVGKFVVVSVEYRLAPEHPYPAGLDDCVKATEFLIKHANRFGVNPNRIAIGGDSAGGNLAAGVALRMRDEDFSPKLKLMVLVYPAVQAFNMLTPSFQQNKYNPIVNPRDVTIHWLYYLVGDDLHFREMMKNDHISQEVKKQMASTYLDITKLPPELVSPEYIPPALDQGNDTIYNELKQLLMNPYVNPLIAKDLSGLPPSYIFTAHHDVLRDEGVLFAQRLQDAGVRVTHSHSEIGFHGIVQFHDSLEEGDFLIRELISFVATHL